MADINELFDKYPDYDVFSGKTNRQKPVPASTPVTSSDVRSVTDYGDGFGIADKPVKNRKKPSGRNIITVLFFPILIIWLEIWLRAGCGEEFNILSLVYTLAFSIPAAFLLTFLCTFFGRLFNRSLCNIISFILTGFYITELCYFSIFGRFFTIHSFSFCSPEQFINALSDKGIIAAALIIPFIINLIFGRFIFEFGKLRASAKIMLILIAVIIQAGIILSLNYTDVDAGSKAVYISSSAENRQERFGLITMQWMEIIN